MSTPAASESVETDHVQDVLRALSPLTSKLTVAPHPHLPDLHARVKALSVVLPSPCHPVSPPSARSRIGKEAALVHALSLYNNSNGDNDDDGDSNISSIFPIPFPSSQFHAPPVLPVSPVRARQAVVQSALRERYANHSQVPPPHILHLHHVATESPHPTFLHAQAECKMLHPIPESLALSATHPHNQLIAALKRIILSSRAPILAILHLTAPLLHALPAIRAACDTYATWLHLEGPALLHHFQQDFLLSFAHSALFEPAFLFHISAPCVFFGHESISQTLVSHPSHIFANSISLTFVCNAYNLSKRISLIHTLSSYTQSIPHILTPTSPVHATSPPLTLHSTSQTSLSHFLHISFPNLFSPSVHALHPVEAAFRLDNPYLPPRFLSRLCVGAVRAVLTARIVDAGGAAFVARLAASPHVRVEQAEGEVWGRVMIAPVGVVAGDVQAWGEGMRRVVALATKGLGAGIRFMVRREVGEDCLSVFVVPRLGGEEEGEGEGEEEEEDVDVVARQVLELSRQWDVSDEVARDFAIAAAEEVVDMVDCIVERLVVEEEDEDDEEEEIRKEGVMQSQVSSSALSSASIEEEKHVEGQVEEQQIVEQPSHNALLTVPSSPTLSESVNMPPIHTNTSTSVPDEPLPRDAQREELFSRHSNSTVSAVPEKVTQAPYRMQRFWTFVFGKDQSDDSSVEQNHIDHDSEEDEIEECKQDMELLEDHFRP